MCLSGVLCTELLKSNKGSVSGELFVRKIDVFAVLPMRFSRSVIYQFIRKVLSHMGSTADDTKTTVAVVSPLDYIRKQQVAAIVKVNFGISTAAIGESNLNKEIKEGRFEIVYANVYGVIDGVKLCSLALSIRQWCWLLKKSLLWQQGKYFILFLVSSRFCRWVDYSRAPSVRKFGNLCIQ